MNCLFSRCLTRAPVPVSQRTQASTVRKQLHQCQPAVESFNLKQESSAHADEEAERFRAFLLRRLLPATQAFYSEHPVAGGDPGEAAALARRMMARLAERTTAELEGRLAEFFARLVQARLPQLREAGLSGNAAWQKRHHQIGCKQPGVWDVRRKLDKARRETATGTQGGGDRARTVAQGAAAPRLGLGAAVWPPVQQAH